MPIMADCNNKNIETDQMRSLETEDFQKSVSDKQPLRMETEPLSFQKKGLKYTKVCKNSQ